MKGAQSVCKEEEDEGRPRRERVDARVSVREDEVARVGGGGGERRAMVVEVVRWC